MAAAGAAAAPQRLCRLRSRARTETWRPSCLQSSMTSGCIAHPLASPEAMGAGEPRLIRRRGAGDACAGCRVGLPAEPFCTQSSGPSPDACDAREKRESRRFLKQLAGNDTGNLVNEATIEATTDSAHIRWTG
eukprot:4530823-Pleurochrysis_carterae.AAC.3